ncbi:hypothetical protein BJ878DRAFT_413708, partial [Calycina marina]
FVSQDPDLFATTIKPNTLLGVPASTSLSKFIATANSAQINELISSLPEGWLFDTSRPNIPFSGGQKQRLRIARALIRKPS